jgi:hypothetical protein
LDIVLLGYSEISTEEERRTGVDKIRLQNWFIQRMMETEILHAD